MSTATNGTLACLDRADLDALKAKVDLVEVIRASGLELKKTGRNWLGRCPWHDDQTASLSVNPQAQLWNCFGCQAGGDVLTFLQLKEELEFPAAVERLQQLAGPNGKPSPTRNGQVGRKRKSAQNSVEPDRAALLGRVAQLYAQTLCDSREAQAYLEARGLGEPSLWEAFGLGYSDGSLLAGLPSKGGVREALSQLGVLTESGRELLRGCLVVPLTHPELGTVNLYGRAIDPEATVKHLYLPGPKRGCLNWQALQTSRELWLTESILDALSLWRAGVHEVSCLFGVGGLPVDLETLLGRYAIREIRWCLDADPAGRQATQRLAANLQAQGLSCRRVELPEGMDPNQVLQERGPEHLARLARSFSECEPPGVVSLEVGSEPGLQTDEKLESGEDGFVWRTGDLTYRITPQPPFTGKLRVKLEAERGGRRFRDCPNLDSHRARALAITQLAGRLQLSKAVLEAHFVRLIDETEGWIRARQEAPAGSPEREMSPAETEEALDFLRRPDLMNAILEDMLALGTVGEEKTKLLVYLIGISRKLARPLSGSLKSQSSAGKSGLTELVEVLTPPEDVVLYSRLTAQALYWMLPNALKHKLLILEERAGAEAADYSIRTLQSRQRLSMAAPVKDPTTGKIQTQTFEVEGPIAYLETTTSAHLNPENATRCFELTLDESEEQTRRIHERQRRTRTPEGLNLAHGREALVRRHHHAQRLLEPVGVVIPYVHLLRFPSRWLRTRRDHERFLSLVEVVACLHQHQRPGGVLADGSRTVEASTYDYRIAFHLAREILAATFHELSRAGRELLTAIREMLGDTEPQVGSFTRRHLRAFTQWQDHRLRNALAELVELEYVSQMSGSQGKTCHYQLEATAMAGETILPSRDLTTPEELERQWP